MYRAKQDNLFQSIARSTEGLPKTNTNQLSMDGPNTNWAALEKFIAAREENDKPKLAEIDSCSLHIVSGSLNAGVNASDWKVHEVMKAMWKVLSDSPARKDIYLKSSISGKLPQRFCGKRWVENKDTAKKAISVWPDIVALVKHFLALCPSKRPENNKSFDKLAQSKFLLIKLTFFKEVEHILNEFLRAFQMDNPMVPLFM